MCLHLAKISLEVREGCVCVYVCVCARVCARLSSYIWVYAGVHVSVTQISWLRIST